MGVAVKVTLVPVQIGFNDATIDTDGTKVAFTVIVIIFDVAVVGLAQARLEVKTQLTRSPLARAALVYVGLFAPTLAPLSFH